MSDDFEFETELCEHGNLHFIVRDIRAGTEITGHLSLEDAVNVADVFLSPLDALIPPTEPKDQER